MPPDIFWQEALSRRSRKHDQQFEIVSQLSGHLLALFRHLLFFLKVSAFYKYYLNDRAELMWIQHFSTNEMHPFHCGYQGKQQYGLSYLNSLLTVLERLSSDKITLNIESVHLFYNKGTNLSKSILVWNKQQWIKWAGEAHRLDQKLHKITVNVTSSERHSTYFH